MAKVAQIPVFFVATKIRQEPMAVAFFTKTTYEPVAAEFVKKKRTKRGVKLYTTVKK